MDSPLLRIRRSVEWAGLIGRSVSVLWVVGSLVLLSLPVTMALWAAPLVLTNLLAWYALRNVARPRYAVLNALEITADTATVTGAVLALSGSSDAALWPIFVIAIIVGAFRGQLAGALLTWLATTAGCVTLYVWSDAIAGRPMTGDLVSLAPALHLVVAILAGLMARGHRAQLHRLAEARAELRRLALHDPLTGLGNRHLLEEFTRAGLTPGACPPRC